MTPNRLDEDRAVAHGEGFLLRVPSTDVNDFDLVRLRDVGLFGGLDFEVLKDFVGTLAITPMLPGTTVFKEGDAGREMFVLVDGEVEVLRRSRRGHETPVAVLGPGDWFGEMSILDVLPRSATTRVLAPARLLRISAQDLDALYRKELRSYSLLVLNVARELSRRLRVADGLVAELVTTVADEYMRPQKATPTH